MSRTDPDKKMIELEVHVLMEYYKLDCYNSLLCILCTPEPANFSLKNDFFDKLCCVALPFCCVVVVLLCLSVVLLLCCFAFLLCRRCVALPF